MTDTIFREARLIVPMNDNKNNPADNTITKVRELLITHFKGYTETLSLGACVMPNGITQTEMVHVFDVATPHAPFALVEQAGHTLRTIARIVLNEMDQEAVYLRHEGIVEFVRRSRDEAA